MDVNAFLTSLQGLTDPKQAVRALEDTIRSSMPRIPVVPVDSVDYVHSLDRLTGVEKEDAYQKIEDGIKLYGEGKKSAGFVTIARGYDALGDVEHAASYLEAALLVAPEADKPLVQIAQAEYDFYNRRDTVGIQKPLEAALGIYRNTNNPEHVRRQASALLSSAHEELIEDPDGMPLQDIPALEQFLAESGAELRPTHE